MPSLALAALVATGLVLVVPAAPALAAESPPARVVPAPTRTPLTERIAAQACPELAPATPSGAVRRVAARSDDEPAPVTELRRACSRLRTGLATLGRTPLAGCADGCPDSLRRSVSSAQAQVGRIPAAPAPWTGGASSCTPPDPTGGSGCVTGATRHGMAVLAAAFGPLGGGPTVRSADCWDAHAWNPHSDHPQGKACDLFPGTAGAFPDETELRAGWRVAQYLRDNAAALDVAYLIWQGRYWAPSVADEGGWGTPYSSSVYDTGDVTGGHYDHVHVSFAE